MKKLILTIILIFGVNFIDVYSQETIKEKFEKSWNTKDTTEKRILREEIARESPNSEYGLFSQAWLFSIKGDTKKAIEFYTKAIQVNPNFPEAYNNRGFEYFCLQEYNKAIADYNKAIELNPNYAEAYYNRGFAYSDLEEYYKAIADFNKAIELNPNDAEAYYDRGIAYYILENEEDACTDWLKAYSLGNKEAKELYEKYCK